jgi:hypothetical protein
LRLPGATIRLALHFEYTKEQAVGCCARPFLQRHTEYSLHFLDGGFALRGFLHTVGRHRFRAALNG